MSSSKRSGGKSKTKKKSPSGFSDISMIATDSGKKTKLSKFAGFGQPVVVIIYASAAPECAPALQSAEEFAFAHPHVLFLLLNVEDSAADAERFLAEQGVARCASFVGRVPSKKYAVREGAYPFHIVISEEGQLMHASEDTFEYQSLIA